MRPLASLAVLTTLAASPSLAQDTFEVRGSNGTVLRATPADAFDEGWAIATLPDGRMLVTEKVGSIVLVSADGRRVGSISGVPEVPLIGQGGLGDIVLAPDYSSSGMVYLSFIEEDGGRSGAVVARAQLDLTDTGGALGSLERVWTQEPKLPSGRHYSHRIAFGPDGYLFVSSGDRGEQTPSQDMTNNVGKIVRLMPDGAPAPGNPFADRGGIAAQFWSVGHRNPLGLAFAPDGNLWSHEMGPRHGDELNRVIAGENYGWPLVSDGDNYSGIPIPDHATDPSFAAPATSWVPAVSPAGLVIYDGDVFENWVGDAVLGGLSGQALIHVDIDGGDVAGEERFEWNERIREVEIAADGAIWALEDGAGGRLIRLEPAR